MQHQEQRDEKTVHIFTGVLLFALVVGVGLGVLWVAEEFFGARAATPDGLPFAIYAAAMVVTISYLYRHRRP